MVGAKALFSDGGGEARVGMAHTERGRVEDTTAALTPDDTPGTSVPLMKNMGEE